MKQHKLFWGSSYDRGLDVLLYMWGDVIKKFPGAELHVCYGWNLFDKANGNNPERMKWKEGVETLMQQKGIVHHGRVGQAKLKDIRKKCGIWAYPTYFTEINCITALESQRDGLVPVVCNFKHKIDNEKHYTALDETVGTGFKIEGQISKPETVETFTKELLNLMADKKLWKKESAKAVKFAKEYDWSNIAKGWSDVFKTRLKLPKVTIVTPTIRQGWWNLMSKNIANQSYDGDIEWIIVDDYEEDRSKLAKEYATKYNLDIKYLRGKERTAKRDYGLVNANNTAWRNATGELLIWLQDFIFMPQDGVEKLVDIYRHNPDAIIAPVDEYFNSKIKPDITKEDWFDGKTDVIGDFYWRNIRVKNEGMRETDNPFDYEANYGAIPLHILKKLNGWWEFIDDGLGYDNTDIAYRALKLGYKIIVDDTNIATCLDHWEPLKTSTENMISRGRKLNDPRYVWMAENTDSGKLPLIRDVELDNKISLPYSIPDSVTDEEVGAWIKENSISLVDKWNKEIEL